MIKPFWKLQEKKNGFFYLGPLTYGAFIFLLFGLTGTAHPADGATEALELRYYAELAILKEQAEGNPQLAEAMLETLPTLLQEYLVTRDGTIALDTVDAAFVEEQFKIARTMEEPGVALALDVFAGPGTGYEHGLRTAIANLADFNERKVGVVSESALEAHERVIERHLEKIEERLGDNEVDHRLDAKLDARIERLESKAEKAEEKAEEKIERAAEKAEEAQEKAEEKSEEKPEESKEKSPEPDKDSEKSDDKKGGKGK